MAASTAKTIEVLFDSTVETYEQQDTLIGLVDFEKPGADDLQNSLNTIWRPVQQHAPILDGWDQTGNETDIIEEAVPLTLGTPKNDFVKQRADDMRDLRFWERRGQQSARRQAAELNKLTGDAIRVQGSLFYRDNSVSGYDFITEAQTIMNERQTYTMDRNFLLSDRTMKKFGSDLAARQTVNGRPESEAWSKGQIGSNVAGFDVFTASYLGNITGGANPATTVTATVSERPEGFILDGVTGLQQNIDYRTADIAVTATAAYNVGDKVSFPGVSALSLGDKTPTDQDMTFTIVAIVDATTVTIYPKPIAADDPGLSVLELASANIDTQIASGATMDRLNIDATARANLFFDKDSVCILGGEIPANLLAQYDGMKVLSQTMKNGQTMYFVYDGKIEDMSLRYRIFTWYGINVINPSACGVAVSYT